MSYQLLTTKPTHRLLSKVHPEWVYILYTAANVAAKIFAELIYTDGTFEFVEIHNIGAVQASEVKIIDASYATLTSAADPAKTVSQIYLQTTDQGGDRNTMDHLLYEPMDFQGDELRAFYYHNGQGGIDSLITEGRLQSNQKTPFSMLTVRNSLKSELSSISRPDEQVWTVNASDRLPVGEAQALRDLFTIRSAFELVPVSGGSVYLPLVILSENVNYGSLIGGILPMSFSYKYAIDNQSNKRLNISNGRVVI